DAGVKEVSKLTDRILEGIAGDAGTEKTSPVTSRQAHFTNLDGVVKVKKANSNSWVTANYSLPLEKGDVVQTSSEGMAKVVFNDGKNQTDKKDSLIGIGENAAKGKQEAGVGVTVKTGPVGLATGSFL